MELSPGIDLSFYAVAIPAVVLLGLAKGGFAGIGLLSLPLMTLSVAPLLATSIILPILIIQDIVTVYAFRKSWDPDNLKVLLPSAMTGVMGAYIFSSRVSDATISFFIGVISLAFATSRLIGFRSAGVGAGRTRLFGYLCGAVSGFSSMIANAGAPPFQIYVLPQRLASETLIGTSAVFFAATNWAKVVPIAAMGQMSRSSLAISITLMPFAIAANVFGIHLARRLSPEKLYLAIYALLLAVSAKLIWGSGFPQAVYSKIAGAMVRFPFGN